MVSTGISPTESYREDSGPAPRPEPLLSSRTRVGLTPQISVCHPLLTSDLSWVVAGMAPNVFTRSCISVTEQTLRWRPTLSALTLGFSC